MAPMSRTTDPARMPGYSAMCRIGWTLCAVLLFLAEPGATVYAQRMMPFSMWKTPNGARKEAEFLAQADSTGSATADAGATDEQNTPLIIDIEALYPTPFGPASPSRSATATIVFRTLEETAISVRLYNVLGQPLAVVHEGQYSAGVHMCTYTPGSDIQSGTYFLALTASDRVRWVRILYLK